MCGPYRQCAARAVTVTRGREEVGDGVTDGVAVGVTVAVGEGVTVGVNVGVAVGVHVAVEDGVAVGDGDGVTDGVGVGFAITAGRLQAMSTNTSRANGLFISNLQFLTLNILPDTHSAAQNLHLLSATPHTTYAYHLPHTTRGTMHLGIHYYPDTLHYRQADLETWLPKLRALGIHWLVLQSDATRAIPEPFVRGLIEQEIQPIVHMHAPLTSPPTVDEVAPLLHAYRQWGVRYLVLFDRPNTRRAWGNRNWSSAALVDRFLDLYLPLAEESLRAGLQPIFPPLEPGGDYWDTAFLRAAIQGIHQRGHHTLLDRLTLGAYGWADEHPLAWGRGGPEVWPEARPYRTPDGAQDQRGFRIFEWYAAISQAVIGTPMPILLLGMGHRRPGVESPPGVPPHTEANQTIARLALGENVEGQPPIPDYVIGGCFWLLAAEADSPHASAAWFRPDGTTLPIVDAIQTLAQTLAPKSRPQTSTDHPIAHYLLLPSYEWGVADFHLEIIHPFVKKHRPTVGFSLEEARLATRVTVIGGERDFPEHELESLRATGCIVQRIQGNGTEIATQLAEL